MSDEQNIFEEENTETAASGSTVNEGQQSNPYTDSQQSAQGTAGDFQQYYSGTYQQNTQNYTGSYQQDTGNPYGSSQQSSGNPYGNYQQQYYNVYQNSGKKQGQGFGIASLVLGIISLVLFCTCINLFLGLLSLVFGIIQIVRYEKKGLAIGGIVTSAVSFVLCFVCWGMLMTSDEFINTLEQEMNQYDDYYEYEYEYEYDYDDQSDDML